MANEHAALDRLSSVIDALLGPAGCPWDKTQTPVSLCDYVIEEAFELVECIRGGDAQGTMEELGDVLFLLLFIARLHKDRGDFTLADSLEAEAAKMIRRHPHVFDDLTIENREELLRNWERIKRQEGQGKTGVFDSLPGGLPPLLKAYRIHSKAARTGFTWESDADMEQALAKEKAELDAAAASGDQAALEEEFGDYLFALTEWGRRKGLKANACLDMANAKFLSRFARMEALMAERGLDASSLSLGQWNALWEEVKAAGRP